MNLALLTKHDSYEFDNSETNIEKMKLISFISFCCAVVTLSHEKIQLTMEGARGKLKLKNFFHLHRHRLKVHPFASFEVGKEMKCTASCLISEECFSFNVKKLTANNFLCELLNTSKYIHRENLTNDESFSHYFLQVPNYSVVLLEKYQRLLIKTSSLSQVSIKSLAVACCLRANTNYRKNHCLWLLLSVFK